MQHNKLSFYVLCKLRNILLSSCIMITLLKTKTFVNILISNDLTKDYEENLTEFIFWLNTTKSVNK